VIEFWRGSREGLTRLRLSQLIAIPALIGGLTGAITIGFVELINLVQWIAIGSSDLPLRVLPHVHWLRVILAPVLGGVLVGPIARSLASEAEGHGVPEVIEAVTLGGGRIRRRVAAVKSLVSALTIGTGGSVGREGPIVQIGAGVGSAVGQWLRLPPEQLRMLASSGAAAGIAAVFNAPIAGAFFALEVVTGNFAMPAFSPVVIASVLATVVSRAYFGDHPAFVVQPYQLESPWEISAYLGLGVFCGLVGVAFIRCMDSLERFAGRLPVPPIWRPALGGIPLGLLIVALPNLYGVGYGTMDLALAGTLSWTLLLVLLPVKIFATSLTLASGGSGGVFLPSLYIGSIAGGLFGQGVHALFPSGTATSGAYGLVGMAGVLSSATNSPITSILLLFEVSGDYKIILPVMIVSTVATLVGRALERDSIYTLKLSRRGIALHRREDVIMRSHTVGQVMRPPARVLRSNVGLADVVRFFIDNEVTSIYVVDAAGRFVGEISIHDIKELQGDELANLVVARDLAERTAAPVTAGATLADCMEQFVLSEQDELPVVDAAGTLVGVVSRRDLLRVYSSELLKQEYLGVTAAAGDTTVRRQLRLPSEYRVETIAVGDPWVGKTLRELNLRATCNLSVVAVRSPGEDDRLPDPERPLREGDRLVVVGPDPELRRFRRGGEPA
jgi:chloride channel protein, CIC family